MKKPPGRIYLQDYGELEPTWCSHQVNDDDVQYRLIDKRYRGADPAAEYAKRNPLGGPAKVFEAMAACIRAGDDFHAVLDDYGFMVKPELLPQVKADGN